MAKDATKVLKLPRDVYLEIDETEECLGYTNGDIQFSYDQETYDIPTDQDGVIDTVIDDDTVTVTTPLLQYDIDLLARVFPHATLVTGAASEKKLVFGTVKGSSLRALAVPLILRPTDKTSADKSEDIQLVLAVPTGSRQISFGQRGAEKVLEVTWTGFRDTSTGEKIIIGDPAVTAA